MSALFNRLGEYVSEGNELPSFEPKLWEEFGKERTVVIIDMAGFTALSRAKGVVYYLTLIQAMQKLSRPVVHACGGRVVKYEADNLFAVFPDPTKALTFIDDVFQKTEAFNEGKESVARLKLCAGLDHGTILLDDADFFGDAVNLASKLGEDMARTGEVLVSQTIVNMVDAARFRFEEVGSHGFYGSALPVYHYQREPGD